MARLLEFNRIEVGSLFQRGGNTWIKRSTRTAAIVKPDHFAGTWFYFGVNDTATVATCVNCRHVLTVRDRDLARAEYKRHGVKNPDQYLDDDFLCAVCNGVRNAENNRLNNLEQ